VLAVARAAVLALVLLAPVLALLSVPFRRPALPTAKTGVLLAAVFAGAARVHVKFFLWSKRLEGVLGESGSQSRRFYRAR
jgi:hypothetical protein